MPEQQTLTMPEVASLAGVQVETLRMWYRRNYLEADGGGGWRRYSVKEAASTVFYANIVRRTKDHEIAKEALGLLYGHIAEQQDGIEQEGLWAFFFRSSKPQTDAQKSIVAMREYQGAPALDMFLHCEIESTAAQFEQLVREMAVTGDYGKGELMPTIIPVHSIWRLIATQIIEFLDAKEQADNK